MKRTKPCNHCGQCCGAIKPDGTQNIVWPARWPESANEWSLESLNEHLLFKLVPHPRISGHRSGTVNVDGINFEYAWIPNFGLTRSNEDRRCPFLVDHSPNEYRCGLYGTSHHKIWEQICSDYPPRRASIDTIIKILSQNPDCSHEYIEDD